jgi:hypothetical protein
VTRQVLQGGLYRHLEALECNPLERGMIRVTYDGKILSPYASVHPALYGNARWTVTDARERGWSLNQVFGEIRRCELAPALV